MKKNDFAEEYAQEKAVRAQYDEAKRNGSEEGKNAASRAYFELEERIASKGKAYARIYGLYRDAQEWGNTYIDLDSTFLDRDVKPMLNCFREYGIEKFTFSSTYSFAVETAWLFIKNGCRLEDLVEIHDPYRETSDENNGKAHGYLFSVGEK
mgnify:CR=1 FL=1